MIFLIDLDFFPEELQNIIDPRRGKKSKLSSYVCDQQASKLTFFF